MKKTHKKQIPVGFVGGGTGGHILPIASLIQYAQENKEFSKKCKYYWFGEQNSMEEDFAKKLSGTTFVAILSGKLRRYFGLKAAIQNIVDIFKVLIGFFQARYLLRKHNIAVLFCKGGYVALPVSFAAWTQGIPVLVHESDMHPGLVNKRVSSIATQSFAGFNDVLKNAKTVGQILSPKLLEQDPIELKNFNINKTTCLVMGGSQGARTIFQTLSELSEAFPSIQFIVITGSKNPQRQQKLAKDGHIWTVGFISQSKLAYLYSVADLSITRGSVTSLAEQELFGIKKVIVPLPYTGGNHQEHNADYFVAKHNDYKIIQDKSLLENLILTLGNLKDFKKDIGKKSSQKDAIKNPISISKEKLFYPHEEIWKTILKIIIDRYGQ